MKKLSMMILLIITSLAITFGQLGNAYAEPQFEGTRIYDDDYWMMETDDAIYYYSFASHLLLYLDEADMVWRPLCSKPECLHDVTEINQLMGEEYKSDCDAFIDCTISSSLGQWEDRIYYVKDYCEYGGKAELCSLKMDGTDHRVEMVLPDEYGIATYGMDCFREGRYYMFRIYVESEVYHSVVYIFDLDDLGKAPKEVDLDGSLPDGVTADGFYAPVADIEAKRVTLYRWDLDGENKKCCADNTHYSNGVYYDKDALYQLVEGMGIICTDYRSGEVTTIWDDMDQYDCPCFIMKSDGQWIYLIGMDELNEQGSQDLFLILDMDGNVVEEMTIPNMKEDDKRYTRVYNKIFAGGTEEEKRRIWQEGNLFGTSVYYGVSEKYIFAMTLGRPNYYFEREEIGSGDCQWKTIGVEIGDWHGIEDY